MRSGCGSTVTTTWGTSPSRRQAPSAESTATIVPVKPARASRLTLSRRLRLGPAATTTARSPSPRARDPRSSTERSMCGRFCLSLSRPEPVIRSAVAAARRLAILRPRSIRPVTLPEDPLLADEADAAAQTRQSLLLELVGRGRGGLLRFLDLRVDLVVALEVLAHVASVMRVAPATGRSDVTTSVNCSR